MMSRILCMALPLLLLVVGGCSEDETSNVAPGSTTKTTSSSLDANVRFKQLVEGFDTVESCRASSPSANCERVLTLCTNSGFTLMLTDILNEGRFTLDGSTVRATRESPGDAPDELTLLLQGDTIDSEQLRSQHPWTKSALSTDDTRLLAEECENLTKRLWWQEATE